MFDLSKDNESKRQFFALRGEAVGVFAHLESVLSSVFGYLSEHKSTATTSAIFFRITQQNTRMEIIERLQQNKYGDKYNIFWKSFLKILRDLNISRNKIIHWELVIFTSTNFEVDGNVKREFVLKRQTFWDEPDQLETLTKNDIEQFIEKCDFASWIAAGFLNFHETTLTTKEFDAWEQAFSQKLNYPLDPAHPLASIPAVSSPK